MVRQRGIAFFLTLCLMAPLVLTYAVLKLRQYEVKENVEASILAGIDKAELVLHKFLKSEVDSLVEWEHDREFEYKGQMYDVVNIEDHGDSIYYYTWWDKAETRIKNQLRQLVAEALTLDPRNQEDQSRLADFLKSLYADSYSVTQTQKYQLLQKWFAYPANPYTCLTQAPPDPPPILV